MVAKPRPLPNTSAKPRKQAARPRRQGLVIQPPPKPKRQPGPKPHIAARGRPTSYDPSFVDEVLELGRIGCSAAQMAAHFDVSRQTIDNWCAQYPDFLEAYARARVHMQATLEQMGFEGLVSRDFNAPVWKTTMQARFREDYTERQELSGPNGGAIPIQTDGPSARELAKAMALTLAKGLKEAGEE